MEQEILGSVGSLIECTPVKSSLLTVLDILEYSEHAAIIQQATVGLSGHDVIVSSSPKLPQNIPVHSGSLAQLVEQRTLNP